MKKILALTLPAVLLLALLCACGGGETKKVDLTDFYATLSEKYQVPATPEQDYPDELADNDDLWLDGPDSREDRIKALEERRDQLRQMSLDAYPGLAGISARQCLAYVSLMSFSGAELVLVQVSDKADADAVKSILQTRVDAQLDGGTWYEEAVKNWRDNARIVSNGSYVMLIVSEDCDAIVSEFNDLFK